MNSRNKILITGGAGFIGSHTADALFKLGYKIRILDNLTPPVHNSYWPKYLSKKYELIKGDIREKKDWLKALKGVDCVFHFAAYQDYLPDFSKFFNVNTVGTVLLYELIEAKKLPIKQIIYASSQAVYGEGKYKCGNRIFYPEQRNLRQLKNKEWDYKCPNNRIAEFLLMKEDDLLKPHNSYGMSKAAAEQAVLNLGKRCNVPTVIMRYSIVQGSRQSPFNAYSGALRIFVSQAFNNQDLIVYEDGKQKRDFVNIKDIIKANLLVFKNKKTDFQIFNVGGDKSYKVSDFAKLVLKIVKPCNTLQVLQGKIKLTGEFRVGDTRNAVSDVRKLKKLGWKPKYTPEDSIKDYFSWYKKLTGKKDFSQEAYKRMKALGVVQK